MNLLITGAGHPLGKLLTSALNTKHSVQALTREECDHRDPEKIGDACQGADAIIHCDTFDPARDAEKNCLDWASRGTYVLMQAALSAGVERVIVASTLRLFDGYPTHFVVDETWQPQPEATAEALAPYLAELTCREFARQGGINGLGIRLGALGAVDGTTTDEAVQAFEGGLDMEFAENGYRWQVLHVSSSTRFATKQAERVLKLSQEGH